MRTFSRTVVAVDELPDLIKHLTQDPISPVVLERRRTLSVAAREVRDQMEALGEDAKEIIRRERGEGPVG